MIHIDITPQFSYAFDRIEYDGESLFITGRAGTGKSTFLDYFRSTTGKTPVVLAPTGVAALNVQGVTIHSFFGFKPGVTCAEAEKAARRADADLYKAASPLIIDEISMVRADLLDCIDVFLRAALGDTRPFGGRQMVFIGDLYQLQPVVASEEKEHFDSAYASPYFFSSRVMTRGGFRPRYIEFERIYRQKDHEFIGLLNAIRTNAVSDRHLQALNSRVLRGRPSRGAHIYLTATNRRADKINKQQLARISSESRIFCASMRGEFPPDSAPADIDLTLKEGARVMLLTNDAHGRWVNGTIGTVEELSEESALVRTQSGLLVDVEPCTWKMFRYVYNKEARTLEKEQVGSFSQLPLRLAWAITIHKSQGKTFDRAVIDLTQGLFAHGQAYVALSRCRSLEGVELTAPFKRGHIRMDYRIVDFLTSYQYEGASRICGFEEKLRIIRDAIEKRSALDITYLKPNNSKSCRTVLPDYVGELEYRGQSYLGMRGHCQMRNDIRVFRVDRILSLCSTDVAKQ